jgi:SAM-dependent methyltransferase
MKCFVCGNENLQALGENLSFPNHEQYSCKECKVGFTFPLPTFGDITQFYRDGYSGVRDDRHASIDVRLSFSRQRALSQYEFVSKYCQLPQGSSALDIGCSDGSLLLVLHEHGFHVTGYEPDKNMAKFAKSRLQSDKSYVKDILFEQDERLEENTYDLVCLSNVFEHIAEPIKYLEKVKKVINKHGILFIEIPNEYDMVTRFWKVNQNFYPVSAKDQGHLYFYSTNSIKNLLISSGFDVLDVATCGENMEDILDTSTASTDKPFLYDFYQKLLSKPQLFTNYWNSGKEGVWIRAICSSI